MATVGEGKVSDGQNTVGNGDLSQGRTIVEGETFDGFDSVRDGYGCQGIAIFKCVGTDGGDRNTVDALGDVCGSDAGIASCDGPGGGIIINVAAGDGIGSFSGLGRGA